MVCYVSAVALALLGALIAGMAALLLKGTCLGIVLGALVSMWIIIIDEGDIISTTALIGVTFALFIACGLFLSLYREKQSNIVAFAALGGLMFASGFDILINGGLIYNIGAVLQKRWPEDYNCKPGKCHLYFLLLVWIAFSVISGLIQFLSLLSPSPLEMLQNFAHRLNGGEYEPVPDVEEQRRDTSIYEDASKQRTLYYPDNQGFNYFNTDVLPSELQQDVGNIYRAATLLANFFGLQDDNVRNQTEHCMLLLFNYRRYSVTPSISAKTYPSYLSSVSAICALHDKVFQNYRDWCDWLQVRMHHHPLRVCCFLFYEMCHKSPLLPLATTIGIAEFLSPYSGRQYCNRKSIGI